MGGQVAEENKAGERKDPTVAGESFPGCISILQPHNTHSSAVSNAFSISDSLKLAPSLEDPREGFMTSLGLGVLCRAESIMAPGLLQTHCGNLWLSPVSLSGSSGQPVFPLLPGSSGRLGCVTLVSHFPLWACFSIGLD